MEKKNWAGNWENGGYTALAFVSLTGSRDEFTMSIDGGAWLISLQFPNELTDTPSSSFKTKKMAEERHDGV